MSSKNTVSTGSVRFSFERNFRDVRTVRTPLCRTQEAIPSADSV